MKRAGIALLIAISAAAAACVPGPAADDWPVLRQAAREPAPPAASERAGVSFLPQSHRAVNSVATFSLADLPLDDPPPLSTFRIPLPTSSVDAERGDVTISRGDLTFFYVHERARSIRPVGGPLRLPCRGHGQPVTEPRLFWQTEGLTFADGGGLVWEIARGFYNPVDCEVQKAMHKWTTLHELVPDVLWGAARAVDDGREVTLVVLDAASVVTSHELGPEAHVTLRLGATLGPQAFARVTLPPDVSRVPTSIATVIHDPDRLAQTLVTIELRGTEGMVFTTREK